MNTADMLLQVYPELDQTERSYLERWLARCDGVVCAEFDQHAHPHALIVRYVPDAIQGMRLLDMVRKIEPAATRVGL